MKERFVSESLKPVAGASNTAAMATGEPGLPKGFMWRGKEYRVDEVLETWKELDPSENGSEGGYLRKHWFKVRTENGLEMTIYFERQAKSRRQSKKRWWLYTVSATQPE